jgi:hypothetical protein
MENTLVIPSPDQLRERIAQCELELRALRRLLRMSVSAAVALEAREARREAAHAK